MSCTVALGRDFAWCTTPLVKLRVTSGAPDDIHNLQQALTEREQQPLELRHQLEERSDELAAARAANRELMTQLNVPALAGQRGDACEVLQWQLAACSDLDRIGVGNQAQPGDEPVHTGQRLDGGQVGTQHPGVGV